MKKRNQVIESLIKMNKTLFTDIIQIKEKNYEWKLNQRKKVLDNGK